MAPTQPHQDSIMEDYTPIIFSSPGLTPDVHFTVFKQEYHAHSIILKLYSNYFRRFLDSPDKATNHAPTQFRYEYTTVVDEDGTWALEPTSKAPELTNENLALVPSLQHQASAFHMLLSAMYNRPYFITTTAHLRFLTSLADFYCALPIVSATLTGAIFNSPIFRADPTVRNLCPFAHSSQNILLWAKQLRHPLLFREAFIHVVAGWHTISSRLQAISEDKQLVQLIQTAHSTLQARLLKAHSVLLLAMLQPEPAIDLTKWGSRLSLLSGPPEETIQFWKSVEMLTMFPRPATEEVSAAVKALLRNNLALDCTGWGPGVMENGYSDKYLCADLRDEDMPWDTTETDW